MAKKRQPTTAAAKDDEPLTPVSKNDQPPPSKKPEEEKVEENDDEDSTSEEASSSEGEKDDESEEEDDDEEEQPPSSQPASKTPQTEKSGSNEDEDEEETDTDSDSDNEPPPKLKSINSKSIDQTLKSKPEPNSSATPARSGTKRSADDDDTKQSKKKKTTATADKKDQEENNKMPSDEKKLFQRVFNEDDELAILKGLVDFIAKTGNDPVKYPTAFYDFVKKSIHFPVTIEQLKDKVRRLKGKFETKMKSCKGGKTPSFSKPNEEKMFEYGKKVWGGNVAEENGKTDEKPSKKGAVKKSPTTKKLVMEPDLQLVVSKETRKESPSPSLILNEIDRFAGVFGVSADFVKSGVELLEESERIELERRWKELQVAELKVVAMRAALAQDQARLILDVLGSSSSSH